MGLFAIRKGERRQAWAAFSTLFAIVASHSVLETARDALFLAKVPATRLPWVYLAIAALSFVLVKLQSWATEGLRPERALSYVTLAASAVTFGFYAGETGLGASGLYALYIWSGVLVTLVLVHFLALASDLFTITQAKRLYGFIGTGSVLGAIVGSGTASLLSRWVAPERLILVAALGFAVSGLLPALFAEAPAGRSIDARPGLRGALALLLRDAYASRVAACLFVATVCLTLADYVFKSTVAALVPRAELGEFLGAVYFGANVLSLICQVWLVARLLGQVSLGAALAVLPTLFRVRRAHPPRAEAVGARRCPGPHAHPREPRSMVERLIQLRASGFGYMNVEALIDLARHMVEVRFAAGDFLWRAGDISTHALTIDYGRVRCTAPDGRHADIGRDFSIGVLDVWGVRKRAYDARAETPIIAYRVNFESFLTLLEAHVEVGVEVLRGFAVALLTEGKNR